MTNAKVIFLAFLLMGGMFLSLPVSAAEYSSTLLPTQNLTNIYGDQVTTFSHNANDIGNKIGLVYFTVPSNSRVDFTLYYGNQYAVSGYMENHQNGFGWTTANVSLNGVLSTYTYWDTNQFYDIDIAGYARQSNDTSIAGFLVSSDSYGLMDNNLASFYQVNDIQSNLIYAIDASGTAPFNIEVVDAPDSDIAENVAHTPLEGLNNWLNYAMGITGAVYDFVASIFGILKFFFIDNLLLIVALWIAVSMAYSAISTNNIFAFYKKFFRLQKALLDFIVSLWNTLVQIVGTIVQIFVKWI